MIARRKRRALACALTVLAAAFSLSPPGARAGDLPNDRWTMYQFESGHNAVFDSPDWDVEWSTALGGTINGGLTIVGQTLYVESFDKKITAINALTGVSLWSQDLPNIAMNAPLVANGIVLVGTGNNHIMYDRGEQALIGSEGGDFIEAFDAVTGAKKWSYNVAGEAMPTGAITTIGLVPEFVFAAGDGFVRALRLSDGQLLWQTQFPGYDAMSSLAVNGNSLIGSSLTTPNFVIPALRNNDANALAHDGWTWSVDAASGRLDWVSPYGWGDSSPTFGQGLVFNESLTARPLTDAQRRAGADVDTNNLQAQVYAFNAVDGTKLWSYFAPDLGPPTGVGSLELAIAGLYANGRFFDSLEFSKEFAAFDAKSGALAWTIPTDAPVKMSAVEVNGTLYFGDTAGMLYAVRASDGTVTAKMKFPVPFTASPPVVVGHTLFIANASTLFALKLEDIERSQIPALHVP